MTITIRRKLNPAELFARARRAEAATGIGNRRILCSSWLYRQCDNMPRSMMGSAAALVGDLMGA